MRGMGGSRGYRPRINPYINYGLHYSPETKYVLQAKSTRGYSPYSKKNVPERYLPEKSITRNEIDIEQILRELEKRFNEKLPEKMKDESGKLEKEVEKAYTEIDAKNDTELDNDKEESVADKLNIEEKDELSEDITSEEEELEVKESIEDKEAELVGTKEAQEVEAVEDFIEVQDIISELGSSIESLPENTNGVESPIETQETTKQAEPIDEMKELPIESFAHDIEELYTELYEIESEPVEEVEPVEETEGY